MKIHILVNVKVELTPNSNFKLELQFELSITIQLRQSSVSSKKRFVSGNNNMFSIYLKLKVLIAFVYYIFIPLYIYFCCFRWYIKSWLTKNRKMCCSLSRYWISKELIPVKQQTFETLLKTKKVRQQLDGANLHEEQCSYIPSLFSEQLTNFWQMFPFYSILYSLKTPENLWFSGVFRGYKMRTLTRNGSEYHKALLSKIY